MSIYRKTPKRTKTNYRTIYKNHYGDIPKDEDGRSYEIHHLDGNNENNDPKNLVALSIHDHYNIHLEQGDFFACWAIQKRLNQDTSMSDLSKLEQKRRIDNGTHHLLKTGSEHPAYKHDVYTFQNILSGEVVKMTMNNFQKTYNLDGSHLSLLISGRCRTIQGWRLLKILPDGKVWRSDDDHKMRDSKIYSFRNRKTDKIVRTTQYDLYTNYGANRRGVNAIVRGDAKFTGDWEMENPIVK